MIEVKDLHKSFGKLDVLRGITETIQDREVVCVIGPSGSGKSTFLRCLNLLEEPTSGTILVDGVEITDEKNDVNKIRENLGMVFQRFNLFPHMNVLDNITLAPMKVKGVDKAKAEAEAMELLKKVGLVEKANVYPDNLSGGQQQRVAIARALVKMPKVLLLDEPLSNLDARLRLQTREEIRRIQKETGITTIFVTHDQEEAMSISDLIVVMKLGIVQQIGQPQEVYDDPTNLFVAKFLGTPPINVFEGKVENEKLFIGDSAVLDVKGVADCDVFIGIRPEGFILDDNGPLTCQLSSVEVMGRDVSVVSTHEAALVPAIRSIINADNKIAAAETVSYTLKPHKVFLFDKETEERIRFEF